MVIVSSDSNTTLVSLGRPLKRIGSLELLQQATASNLTGSSSSSSSTDAPEFERTHLYLPQEDEHDILVEQDNDDCEEDDDDDGYWGSAASSAEETSVSSASSDTTSSFSLAPEPLYLPTLPKEPTSSCDDADAACSSYHRHRSDSCDSLSSLASSTEPLSVDTCLSYLPSVVERCDELLASAEAPQQYCSDTANSGPSSPRLVYVSQGEVGHAVPLQCDVLVSDRATTCHILALHSTSHAAVPLSTLTHLDGTQYHDCLRKIFQQHEEHHRGQGQEDNQDDSNNNQIHMSLHMLGGYHDEHGTSQQLSNWLVRTLAQLADEYQDSMHCTLATAAISSLNHNRLTAQPLGRGLAMSTRTGQVWLAAVQVNVQDDYSSSQRSHVAGPDYTLRQLRLWCVNSTNNSKASTPQLSVIHTPTSPYLTRAAVHIPAFPPALATLLQVPDELLLQYTSTSPLCEQDDFCASVRATLRLWQQCQQRTIPAQAYKRQRGRSDNEWRPVAV